MMIKFNGNVYVVVENKKPTIGAKVGTEISFDKALEYYEQGKEIAIRHSDLLMLDIDSEEAFKAIKELSDDPLVYDSSGNGKYHVYYYAPDMAFNLGKSNSINMENITPKYGMTIKRFYSFDKFQSLKSLPHVPGWLRFSAKESFFEDGQKKGKHASMVSHAGRYRGLGMVSADLLKCLLFINEHTLKGAKSTEKIEGIVDGTKNFISDDDLYTSYHKFMDQTANGFPTKYNIDSGRLATYLTDNHNLVKIQNELYHYYDGSYRRIEGKALSNPYIKNLVESIIPREIVSRPKNISGINTSLEHAGRIVESNYEDMQFVYNFKNMCVKVTEDFSEYAIIPHSPSQHHTHPLDVDFNWLEFDAYRNQGKNPLDNPIVSFMNNEMGLSETTIHNFALLLNRVAMIPDNSFKKVLWVYGDGDTGKSLFQQKLIYKIVRTTKHVAIKDICSEKDASRATAELPTTGLNVDSDYSGNFILNDITNFKKITGNDGNIYTDKKYGQAGEKQIRCGIMVFGNSRPKLSTRLMNHPGEMSAMKLRIVPIMLHKQLERSNSLIKRIETEVFTDENIRDFAMYALSLFDGVLKEDKFRWYEENSITVFLKQLDIAKLPEYKIRIKELRKLYLRWCDLTDEDVMEEKDFKVSIKTIFEPVYNTSNGVSSRKAFEDIVGAL